MPYWRPVAGVGEATWELVHPQVGTAPFPLWFWGCSPEVIISAHQGLAGCRASLGTDAMRGHVTAAATTLGWWEGGSGDPAELAGRWVLDTWCHSTWMLPNVINLYKRNEAVLAPPLLRPVCEEEMPRPGGERQQFPGPVSAWIAQRLPLPCSLCCVPSHCSWKDTNGGFCPPEHLDLTLCIKYQHPLTLLSCISPNSPHYEQIYSGHPHRGLSVPPHSLPLSPNPPLFQPGSVQTRRRPRPRAFARTQPAMWLQHHPAPAPRTAPLHKRLEERKIPNPAVTDRP